MRATWALDSCELGELGTESAVKPSRTVISVHARPHTFPPNGASYCGSAELFVPHPNEHSVMRCRWPAAVAHLRAVARTPGRRPQRAVEVELPDGRRCAR